MNLKAMNVKKGLKRFWIVGSVFWLIYLFIPRQEYFFGIQIGCSDNDI